MVSFYIDVRFFFFFCENYLDYIYYLLLFCFYQEHYIRKKQYLYGIFKRCATILWKNIIYDSAQRNTGNGINMSESLSDNIHDDQCICCHIDVFIEIARQCVFSTRPNVKYSTGTHTHTHTHSKRAVLFLDNDIVIVIAFSGYYFIKQMVL